ncbi:MAG: DNA primase, partial [Acetatifactor sp.]|nr:DNA primase [Acetatifactor sp.]
MFYPEELIEEVRVKNDIVDVVSGYVRLQKRGANHWACCPFHNENTPSFSVNGAKQMYHCFGCGKGGNVFTFVMEYENYSFPEAVKMLAARAGVTLPEAEYDGEQKQRRTPRQPRLDVHTAAAAGCYFQLRC